MGCPAASECIVRDPQLFREVFAVKIAIWGVTCPPPQVGHAAFAAARSATVSTTSKLFLQRSHMNAYVGIGSLPALPVPSEERLDLTLLGSLSRSRDQPSDPGQNYP